VIGKVRSVSEIDPVTSRSPRNFTVAGSRSAGRVWSWLGLAAVLLLGAALRLWGIDRDGYGNQYFSAAVRSMLDSWHNFFFNSFDPAGFVSLDKPPVAFWIQVASAKLLGYSGRAVILPQVVEGMAAIALVYYLVRRRFGTPAGLLAALFLAITPVSVTMDRGSNTDTCLVLVLLLAAWALTRAAESGSRHLFLLSMALLGIGFNVKMLEAFGVLPIFLAVYSVGAPMPWQRRLVDLAMAGVVLLAVSLSWSVAYDLTPAAARPFVGSSTGNSMIELAAVYNGIDRFIPRAGRFLSPARANAVSAAPGGRPAGTRPMAMRTAPAGPLRLATPQLAGQAEWFLPLAIMGLVPFVRRRRLNRPLDPTTLALLLWGGWAATYAVVYSFAGGAFRPYYLLTLAPPLAALAGIGVMSLWSCYSRKEPHALLLPAALLATAAWQLYIEHGYFDAQLAGGQGAPFPFFGAAGDQLRAYRPGLYVVLIGGTVLAATGLMIARRRNVRHQAARGLAAAALGLGLFALLVTPSAWALNSMWGRGNGVPLTGTSSPAPRQNDNANESGQPVGRFGGYGVDQRLIAFLFANARGERYLLATSNAMVAAPIIIQTGRAVMAMGGFTGSDPIITPERLARLVREGQVRFVMIGGTGRFGRGPAGNARLGQIAEWVREHGKPLPPELWRSPQAPTALNAAPGGSGRRFPDRAADMQLYDLAPADGLIPAH
jgi:4-amino-4-deoxy-L-arabinose transferase-like glycosyltransferase